MARYDNRSINQPVLMFGTETFQGGGDPQTSLVFDTAGYDAGYTIALNVVSLSVGTFDMAIQTSDSSSSGFAAVDADKLIGGVIPNLNNTLLPGPGAVSVSRGVVDAKRYVRVQFSNLSSIPLDTTVYATLNGTVEGAPPSEAEGTLVNV